MKKVSGERKKPATKEGKDDQIGFRPDHDVAEIVAWGMRITGKNKTSFVQEVLRRAGKATALAIHQEMSAEINKPPTGEARELPKNLKS